MCRVYGVTRAGYYTWLNRGPSQRTQENAWLSTHILQVHPASRGTYEEILRQLTQQAD